MGAAECPYTGGKQRADSGATDSPAICGVEKTHLVGMLPVWNVHFSQDTPVKKGTPVVAYALI